MEAQERTIIVSSSRAQRKYQIQSKATTLEEFKAECRDAGIDYSGLTFVEAISNTEMRGDNSLLPKEVTYKGQRTNTLVFSLTTPRKNIGSGAMDRKEAYAKIKELGLQQACMDRYGNNYTRVSTSDLVALIEAYQPTRKQKPAEKPMMPSHSECPIENPMEALEMHLRNAMMCMEALKKESVSNGLSEDEVEDILGNF